ncbi:MAG: hypothetical protein CL904_05820 [Dehalococcoidia bacterium]|nr:hypothetical protein [Dehalococcoidia bacterium]
MKAIPIIYPIILILLVIFLIFVSAYSIAESATVNTIDTELNSERLINDNRGSMFSWYEETAIFICPLH